MLPLLVLLLARCLSHLPAVFYSSSLLARAPTPVPPLSSRLHTIFDTPGHMLTMSLVKHETAACFTAPATDGLMRYQRCMVYLTAILVRQSRNALGRRAAGGIDWRRRGVFSRCLLCARGCLF